MISIYVVLILTKTGIFVGGATEQLKASYDC